jgi:putative membrane protein
MKMSSTLKSIAACAVASLLLFSTPPAFAQGNPSLSDPEVASVAVVANQIDIDYASIARKRSANSEVLRFAETMARDHKAVIAKAVALAQKLGVTPQDNAVSKQLRSDAKKTTAMLNKKSGKAFDKAYIANEVAYHKAVINAVENLLIPETENAELKQLLQDILPALKAHLAHAEMVNKDFN